MCLIEHFHLLNDVNFYNHGADSLHTIFKESGYLIWTFHFILTLMYSLIDKSQESEIPHTSFLGYYE